MKISEKIQGALVLAGCTLLLAAVAVFTQGCAPRTPYDDCAVLANATCQKLDQCSSYTYESCYDSYLQNICEDVELIEESYEECLQDVSSLTCEENYPPDSCDDGVFTLKE